MKTVNIIGLAVLGWIVVANAEETQTQPKQNTVYVYVPSEAEGCGCNVCENCSCTEAKSCSECASTTDEKEVAVDDTAANFPRPRNPCPGGPGRR